MWDHFDIVSTLLQQAHRNLSAAQVQKLGKLRLRSFNQAKKQFVLPLPRLIALSQEQPVRLIVDYVLMGRDTATLTFPFNYLYNYNTGKMQPTLYVLFVLAQVGESLYPIALEFWGQQEWALEQDIYLTKRDVAEAEILGLAERGLEIEEVLFDAGFCSKAFLDALAELEIPYICRFPRSWQIECLGQQGKAADWMQDNRRFFFDRYRGCFLDSAQGVFGQHSVQLVAVANSRQKLDSRKYYCLLTNQLNLKPTQVLRHYLQRGQIEWFFRQLKSYLGLMAFHRHHPDEALIPHFQLRCAAFILVQDFAKDVGLTIFEALRFFKTLSLSEIQQRLKSYWLQWAQFLVNTSTQQVTT